MTRTKTSAPARRCSVLLLLAVLALPVPGHAEGDGSEAAFQTVRDDVAAFRKDDKRRRFRHNYLRLVERLRKVADDHKDGARADDALYVAAQLLDELSQASHVGEDLDAAVASFESLAARYPGSNLADDALFQAARIRLERRGDRDGARMELERLLALEGTRDFAPRARELLARLPPAETEQKVAVAAPAATTDGATAKGPSDQVAAILARVTEKLDAEAAQEPIPQIEVLPDAPPPGTPARKVSFIKHRKEGKESVVAMRLSGEVGVQRGEVPESRDKARRLFFDLSPAKLGTQAIEPVEVGDGVVRRVRAGQYDNETVRLVIELEGEEEPSLHVQRSPFELRLVVPLEREPAPVVAKAVPAPVVTTPVEPAPPQPAPAAEAVRERLGSTGAPGGVSISQQFGLKVRRIVLDAGHGGHDTGAIGPSGVREKEVTLAIARRVRQLLHKRFPDIEVVMTRDDDRFIELTDRTNIANEAGADLFISIHANANPSRKVRGIETYYLNITHDRYAIRLAARENAASHDEANISDLQYILADLAMKSNVDDSIRLGRQVQRSVVGRLRESYSGVKDLGLKHALFAVLIGARMPAILVETSFVSNRTEEKRLGSTRYQQALAEGIVQGVRRFLEERQAFYAGK